MTKENIDKNFCPLSFLQHKNGTEMWKCIERKCAWWVYYSSVTSVEGACAIVANAAKIRVIGGEQI